MEFTHIFCLSISLLLKYFLPLDAMMNGSVLLISLWDDLLLLYRNVIVFFKNIDLISCILAELINWFLYVLFMYLFLVGSLEFLLCKFTLSLSNTSFPVSF